MGGAGVSALVALTVVHVYQPLVLARLPLVLMA